MNIAGFPLPVPPVFNRAPYQTNLCFGMVSALPFPRLETRAEIEDLDKIKQLTAIVKAGDAAQALQALLHLVNGTGTFNIFDIVAWRTMNLLTTTSEEHHRRTLHDLYPSVKTLSEFLTAIAEKLPENLTPQPMRIDPQDTRITDARQMMYLALLIKELENPTSVTLTGVLRDAAFCAKRERVPVTEFVIMNKIRYQLEKKPYTSEDAKIRDVAPTLLALANAFRALDTQIETHLAKS